MEWLVRTSAEKKNPTPVQRDVDEIKDLIIISLTGTPLQSHLAVQRLADMGLKVEVRPGHHLYN